MSEISLSHEIEIAKELVAKRAKAHEKHGDKSIENVGNYDRLMTILTEEVGEVAMAINDAIVDNWSDEQIAWNVRLELIDVMTVCSAWVARIDRDSE